MYTLFLTFSFYSFDLFFNGKTFLVVFGLWCFQYNLSKASIFYIKGEICLMRVLYADFDISQCVKLLPSFDKTDK